MPGVAIVIRKHYSIQRVVEKEDSPFRTDAETMRVKKKIEACFRSNHNGAGTVCGLHPANAVAAFIEKQAALGGHSQQSGGMVDEFPEILCLKAAYASQAKDDD